MMPGNNSKNTRNKNNQIGMTLPEALVGLAITSAVSVFAMNLITDFIRRKWEAETKAGVTSEIEVATSMMKNTLPPLVENVIDSVGKRAPGPSIWTCSTGTCSISVNYSYKDIDGVPGSTLLSPMRADCVEVADSALAPADVGLHTKSTISAAGSGCLSCPEGQAPQLTVNLYNFNPTTGVPTTVGTKKFPFTVGKMSKQSALAIGVCVTNAPYSYKYFNTNPAVVRYDRWEVTLIPVYARRAPTSGMTATEIGSLLVAAPDKILITPSRRFAPGFRYTPIK